MMNNELSNIDNKQLRKIALNIEMSQGEFKLIFVHCNYINFQRYLAHSLTQLCLISIIELDELDTVLYSVINKAIADKKPIGVQILGLEKVTHLEQLLTTVDQVRDEFKKQFDFPLLIWVNNEIQTQFIHKAPNFYSWGIKTAYEVDQKYIESWLQETVNQFLCDDFCLTRQEGEILKNQIEVAREYLEPIKTELAPEVTANLTALLGLAKRVNSEWEQAINLYQQARESYQQIADNLPLAIIYREMGKRCWIIFKKCCNFLNK